MVSKEEQSPQIPDLKPGTYSDGGPLDEVHYLECKLILKPDRFNGVPSFHDYAKLVRRAADECEVEFCEDDVRDARPRIREVIFLDTKNFTLYNHAFILRRRIAYQDGFPAGDPEVVFKFRHPDLQIAAETDVRPRLASGYRIKFKAEALPLKDRIGGLRMLYSHNVEFGLRATHDESSLSLNMIAALFPVLATLRKSGAKKLNLVNHTIVEEVLQDFGELNFGKGVTTKSNALLWRERGDHKPLVGEFSFEAKFKKKDEIHEKALDKTKKFFVALQEIGRDWVSVGTTKTGVVYRFKGNPPQSHE